jgi:NAD(P)-dependent dehydrogenase (short-subunit alcohol dehydrogenase family)
MTLKDLFKLDGKTALITGSAHGLGKKIALGLAECGVSLFLADIDCPRKTERQIKELGTRSIAVETDIADETQVRDLVAKAVAEFGKVDILINNAGVSQLSYTPTEQLAVEEWDRITGINLRGTFLCCKHIGKFMIENGGGKIVNISSTAGITGVPRAPAYCASKAGVILLTKSLALEWARYNIHVNAIAPHYLETDLTKSLRNTKTVYSSLIQSIPLKRFGKTSDLIGAVLLLSSEASGYMTGSVLTVDGGYLSQ